MKLTADECRALYHAIDSYMSGNNYYGVYGTYLLGVDLHELKHRMYVSGYEFDSLGEK